MIWGQIHLKKAKYGAEDAFEKMEPTEVLFARV